MSEGVGGWVSDWTDDDDGDGDVNVLVLVSIYHTISQSRYSNLV